MCTLVRDLCLKSIEFLKKIRTKNHRFLDISLNFSVRRTNVRSRESSSNPWVWLSEDRWEINYAVDMRRSAVHGPTSDVLVKRDRAEEERFGTERSFPWKAFFGWSDKTRCCAPFSKGGASQRSVGFDYWNITPSSSRFSPLRHLCSIIERISSDLGMFLPFHFVKTRWIITFLFELVQIVSRRERIKIASPSIFFEILSENKQKSLVLVFFNH